MRWRIFLVLWTLFISGGVLAQPKVQLSPSFQKFISDELKPFFTLSDGQMEDVLKGDVISTGKVSTPKPKEQQMMLFTTGIHPRNCNRAMRKLSLYENYPQYIDFIKSSKYDEATQRITFTVDHTLLPFPMVVSFKIPRITKEGHYPFVFEDGFMKDLKGTVIVKEIGKFCLMGLKADWRGPETKIPNLPFEMFMQTAGKIGLEHLIRVSIF